MEHIYYNNNNLNISLIHLHNFNIPYTLIEGQAHPWVVPLETSHFDFSKPIKL